MRKLLFVLTATMMIVLFGFGTKTGALGVTSYSIFGPERGFIGLVLNLAAFALLVAWWKRKTNGSHAVSS